ncbi:bifunctional pinoresinol-lariciresinol reductase 2-like [Aristolochia californica]|uniref:bifunctional pinoresinol-lariciresinol reductase 2-like n=1 Tax=Aristolochia californica TaxID=171875 RepID=UPI0035D689C1
MEQKQKDRVLIVGGTGYLGRRLVQASLALGYPTFVLYRPEIASDPEKVQMLFGLKRKGATLLKGSLNDLRSLVSALKQVDVVISALAGNHLRLAILEQLTLVEAIKEVGTIKRFLPSEFGMDAGRMEHAIPPGDQIFAEKRVVRRAIEKAGIPHTYVSANCFAAFFLPGLAQIGCFMPPSDHVLIYGSGDKKCIWLDEDDIAMYVMKTVDDPRTLNKTVYLRPPANILSQLEVVNIWEKLAGTELQKTFVSDEEFLAMMEKYELPHQIGIAHVYQIFCVGDLYFPLEGSDKVDSHDLYPEYKYVTVEEYLKRFV